MYLRTPQAKITVRLLILFGSKAGRVHSQSTQHYLQRIRTMVQPLLCQTPLATSSGECRVVSWEKHRLEQIYFNSQNDHLPARAQNKSLQLILFVCKIVINNLALAVISCKWEKEEKSIRKGPTIEGT